MGSGLRLLLRLGTLSIGNDRDGAPRYANETLLLVHDLNIPDMSRSTDVDWSRRCANDAFRLCADMVRVDLESYRAELLPVDVDDRSDRRHRFSESD